MKTIIVCVNFHSYNELKLYLNSIEAATKHARTTLVDVIVADNSINKKEIDSSPYTSINVDVKQYNNIGYLGAAQSVINSTNNILQYDYVVISNVDIVMKEDFFNSLSSIILDDNIAWIAPKIYSQDEHRDRNPKVFNRYSKKRLSMIYYMYKYPILFYLYTMTAYKRKKLQKDYSEMDIYAGHGSFMMLTRSFFESYKQINYPIFLFGEELFLAEEIRKVGKRVKYVPSLVIEDNEHVSTSTLKKRNYFKYNQDSIKYILDNYYNE